MYAFESLDYKANINDLILDILSITENDILDLNLSSQVNTKYMVKLVKGVLEDISTIDKQASQYLAKEWKINRLPKLVRNIIRVAIFELISTKELSSATLINEYLELAKLFKHEGEVGFINSVLDQIAKEKE
jgi:N utilization substance protein B